MTTGQGPENLGSGHPDKVRAAVLLALAAATAVFAALGIEGETLRRVVRNDPEGTATFIGLVIVGLSIPLIVLAPVVVGRRNQVQNADSKWEQVVNIVSAGLVVLGLMGLVVMSASSLHEREMPTLSTSPAKVSGGTINIKYKATAPSLRSDEKILLRVVAFTSEIEEDNLSRLCLDPEVILPNSDNTDPEMEKRRVIYWGESGPNRAGEASVTADVSASTPDFRYVCAFTTLFNTDQAVNAEERSYFAWSVTDLLNPLDETQKAPSTTTPTPTPTSTSG